MNPVKLSLAPAAASANGIATSQTPTSGTALTKTAAVVTLDIPRRVLLTHGNEASARTLRITGTNRNGVAQSETLAVPSGGGGTVASVLDFATVSELMPLGGGWSAAVTVGTNAVASTPWVVVEWTDLSIIGTLITIPSAGPTVQLEVTWDDPGANLMQSPYGMSVEPASFVPPRAVIAPGFTTDGGSQAWSGITTTQAGRFDIPVYAVRLTNTAGAGQSYLQLIFSHHS